MTDQYPRYPGDRSPAASSQQPATYGAPAPAAPAYGQSPSAPTVPFASWWARVGASVLDSLIAFAVVIVPFGIGMALAFKDAQSTTGIDPVTGFQTAELTGGVNPIGVVIAVLGVLLGIGFTIWNLGIRQGKRGQSLGKKALGISVVRTDTGSYLGAGAGALRWLMAALLGNLCFINFLWPLWDEKKQAWHDKVVGSVVIKAP